MLIYRNDGKLHCVSKKALKLAGYNDISQFLNEHNDYSELFVKKPGYIYNFENFSWLSFLKNAKTEQKKVLIATSDKATYECELSLEVLFPVDFEEGASEFYYQIEFNRMKLLTGTGDTITEIEVPSFESTTVEQAETVSTEEPSVFVAEAPQVIEKSEPDVLLFEEPATETRKQVEPDILFATETPAPTEEKREALEVVDFSFGDEIEKEEKASESGSAEREESPIVETPSSFEGVPDIGLKEDLAAVSAPASGESEPQKERPATGSDIEMPDIRKVSGTLGLPETMVKAFVKEFVDTYYEDLDEVKHAIDANLTAVVKKEAMKLKGIASNLMMHPLTETLQEILTTKDDETVRSRWNEIDAYMQALASLYSPEKTSLPETPSVTAGIEANRKPEAVFEKPVEETSSEEPSPVSAGKRLQLEIEESDETIEFDPAEAANALGLPESLIIEFVNDFVQQADEERAGFERAYEADDIKTINEIAHKLKGVAANLRIEDMRQLMENAQHAKTLEDVEKSLTAFYRKLVALKRSMAKEYA